MVSLVIYVCMALPLHSSTAEFVNCTEQKYDVLLNSYMRSGSTLAGHILGWRNDSFYLYEPLWKVSTWTYYNGNRSVCRLDRMDCRNLESERSIPRSDFIVRNKNVRRRSVSLQKAKDILQRLFGCEFHDFAVLVYQPELTDKQGGPRWRNTVNCTKTSAVSVCFERYLPLDCKTAQHRVSKVLRLSVDNLDALLENRTNLKAIHLFRDPRAIVNSRLYTRWYPSGTETNVLDNAKGLCHKMLIDFREGVKLLEKYPDRFRFVFYEDLNNDPFEKVKLLYKYLGMSLDPAYYSEVKTLSIFTTNELRSERERNTAFWWRKTLSWKLVEQIDRICKDVMANLGYKRFVHEDALRNLSLTSVDIPKPYLLL